MLCGRAEVVFERTAQRCLSSSLAVVRALLQCLLRLASSFVVFVGRNDAVHAAAEWATVLGMAAWQTVLRLLEQMRAALVALLSSMAP